MSRETLDVDADGCTFQRNKAEIGALFFSDSDMSLSLKNSLMVENEASDSSGVLGFVGEGGLSLYAENIALDIADELNRTVSQSLFHVQGNNIAQDLCNSAVLVATTIFDSGTRSNTSGEPLNVLFDVFGSLWLVLDNSELQITADQVAVLQDETGHFDCFMDIDSIFPNPQGYDAVPECRPVCPTSARAVLELWQPDVYEIELQSKAGEKDSTSLVGRAASPVGS